MMSESNFLTLASIALFEAKAIIASCLASCVVSMEIHSFDLKSLLQRSEKILSILLIEVVRHLS